MHWWKDICRFSPNEEEKERRISVKWQIILASVRNTCQIVASKAFEDLRVKTTEFNERKRDSGEFRSTSSKIKKTDGNLIKNSEELKSIIDNWNKVLSTISNVCQFIKGLPLKIGFSISITKDLKISYYNYLKLFFVRSVLGLTSKLEVYSQLYVIIEFMKHQVPNTKLSMSIPSACRNLCDVNGTHDLNLQKFVRISFICN